MFTFPHIPPPPPTHTPHTLVSLSLSLYFSCAKSLKSCLTLCNPTNSSPQAPLSMGFWSTGVGCRALLQGIFLSQGLDSNVSCTGWQVLYHQHHLRNPYFSCLVCFSSNNTLSWVTSQHMTCIWPIYLIKTSL